MAKGAVQARKKKARKASKEAFKNRFLRSTKSSFKNFRKKEKSPDQNHSI